MSFFDELLALDRPYVPCTLHVGKAEKKVLARRPNAEETDAIEAFYADTYAQLIISKTEGKAEGKASELERMRTIYSLRSRDEILDQILGTRKDDIRDKAVKISGIMDLPPLSDDASEADKDEREATVRDMLKAAWDVAVDSIKAEYDDRETSELVDLIAQVNINIQSINEARMAQAALRVFFSVYTEEDKRAFDTVDQVRQFQSETIFVMVSDIERAFAAAVPTDLPFELQGDPEQSGPSPLPSTSAEDTKASGKPTKTRRNASK